MRFKWCPKIQALACNYLVNEPHAHICIRDVGSDDYKLPCKSLTLNLEFHDLDDKSPGNFHPGLFKESHAREIVRFVESLEYAQLVLINCEGGISRSPGVVLALRRNYGGDTEEVYKKAHPNIFVTNILSKVIRDMQKPCMPEPTGEMAKVPKGWPPQTWGAHLANCNWMKELNQSHYSRTDAKWHVKRFRERIIRECAEIADSACICGGKAGCNGCATAEEIRNHAKARKD